MAYKYNRNEYTDDYGSNYPRDLYFNSTPNRRQLFPQNRPSNEEYYYRRPLEGNYRNYNRCETRDVFNDEPYENYWTYDRHLPIGNRYPPENSSSQHVYSQSNQRHSPSGQENRISPNSSFCGSCSSKQYAMQQCKESASMQEANNTSSDQRHDVSSGVSEKYTLSTPTKLRRHASDPTDSTSKSNKSIVQPAFSPTRSCQQKSSHPLEADGTNGCDTQDNSLYVDNLDICGEDTFDNELFVDLLKSIAVLDGK